MISLVIPLFNEEENVNILYKRLKENSPSWNEEYEIIIVDDGSYDNTLKILKGIAQDDSTFKIVKLSRNFGHQAAISAGIKQAKGDAVIVLDGDLQDPPEVISDFLAKWRDGFQVVYAIRKKRKEGFFKRASYKIFYRLLKVVSDIDIPIDSGDFCLMDKKVVDVLNKELVEHNKFLRGLRAYAGFNQVGITYERDERNAGDSKYTNKKLFKLAIDGLLDFSTFPLKIATFIGFGIAFTSFLVGLFFIVHRIFDFKILGYSPTDTPGFATLAVGVFFIGGIIMIMLGVIGEYLGRIYFEVKKRPFYIIDEVIKNESSKY